MAAFADLAEFRYELGLQPTGTVEGDKFTLARLDIADERIYGISGHGQPTDFETINRATPTHAEGDVFQQAKNMGLVANEATLYIDQPLCGYCGANGGLGSLMRGSGTGLQELTVYTPEGAFLITAARPSVPIRIP